MRLFFSINDLIIREGGPERRAEINNTLTSINQPVIPQPLEATVGGLHYFVVKCKSEPAPVAAGAERSELRFKVGLILLYEVPHL